MLALLSLKYAAYKFERKQVRSLARTLAEFKLGVSNKTFDALSDKPALQHRRKEETYEQPYDAGFIRGCVGTAARLLNGREADDKKDEPECMKDRCW